MKQYRVEQDFLGKKYVPVDAYYGIQTVRAVENFPITGYHLDDEFIKAMAIVKKAAAKANYEIGQPQKPIATAIMEAADDLIDGKFRDQIVVDPVQGGQVRALT